MEFMDIYYRAFNAFKDHTQDDVSLKRLRKLIARANHQHDVLTSIKYDCDIDSDWIENIEEGLIYVQKAIDEERQFIRTEGEVVPIGKVKQVSKASVKHLAKHSDLITRVPQDKRNTLIPDELYVVEKLNDYAIYENRFLYMLLSYLKDFIEMRLTDIKDKTTSYRSHMEIDKTLNVDQRHLEFQLKHNDLFYSDPLLLEQFHKIPLVERIENIYNITVSLLKTDLMSAVAKVGMIKPPVVKTNVLRMNQNFRASLKLYDYVTSYTKDGYTIKEVKKTFNPFPKEMEDEVADTIQLFSTIAYIEGNDLREHFKETLEKKQRELKEAEDQVERNEIKRLKKRMDEMQEDPSEYILKLEKRNVALEKDTSELSIQKDKNESLKVNIETLEEDKTKLEKNIHALEDKVALKENALEKMKEKYYKDLGEAEETHKKEIETLHQKHLANIEDLKDQHAQKLDELEKDHEHKIQELEEAYKQKEENLIKQHTEKTTSLNTQIQSLKEDTESLKSQMREKEIDHQKASKDYENEIRSLKKKISRLEEEKNFEKARYLGLKKQQGLISKDVDFTSKEEFEQLEKEMDAYKKLFKEQWKKAKRRIREDVKKDVFKNKDSKKKDKDKQ